MQYKLLRQSHLILVARLIGLDIIITILYLFFRISITVLQLLQVSTAGFYGVSIIDIVYFIIITVAELTLGTWIVLSWANEEWEIKEGVIFHRRGIFHMKEDAYSLKQIGSTTLNQGLLGKLFNYGTIKIFSPLLKQDYYLMNIHNPREIAKTLEDEVAGTNQKHGTNIFFKKS
ncbi:MAG TPA: PH domain-containing protein [Candidatus Acidoferrales bacterium]|nr:PH domain-containing protein [Candidatus Acidoferrales bacterium]